MHGQYNSTTSTLVNKTLIIFSSAARQKSEENNLGDIDKASLLKLRFPPPPFCFIFQELHWHFQEQKSKKWLKVQGKDGDCERENIWVIQMSACLGFRSFKKYSQNETVSRAQRDGFHPKHYNFPAVILREVYFLKKRRWKKIKKRKISFHKPL